MKQSVQAAHLVLEDRVISGSMVWENGLIVSIAEHPVVETEETWLMPGLIDFHTHGFGGINVSRTPDPQACLLYTSRCV